MGAPLLWKRRASLFADQVENVPDRLFCIAAPSLVTNSTRDGVAEEVDQFRW
jgi:hypothetical protein